MSPWSENKKIIRAEDEIFEAVRDGDIVFTGRYVADGGDINARNFKGRSLLMIAATNDNLEICRLLIDNGADVNSVDYGGNTILMSVAFKGNTEILRLLLESSADPLIENSHGMTALDFAKAFGRVDIIQILSSNPYCTLQRISILVRMLNRMKS